MRFSLLLLLLFPSLLLAQESKPELAWTSQTSGATGLTIRHVSRRQIHPVLPYVFFDAGSATIPQRYHQFSSADQTRNFSDTMLQGSSLEQYRDVLNIIGYRMMTHPRINVQVVGCNSTESAIGETKQISQQRAQVVHDYLVNIWKIDPARIKLSPARDLPEMYSNIKDQFGVVENRRVEIIGSDWEMLRPIVKTSGAELRAPEGISFETKNGIADDQVADRRIEITQGGSPWRTITSRELSENPFIYRWGRNGDNQAMPQDAIPFVAQLVVTDNNGTEHRSTPVEIPVRVVTAGSGEIHLLRAELIQFNRNSSEVGPVNARIIREFISSGRDSKAAIVINGHTDIVGLEDANMRISQNRSNTVATAVRSSVSSTNISSLDARGYGEENPPYDNALPEARFYNRTVIVEVTMP